MQLGFGAPVSGSWATPDNQVTIAGRAEAAGYSTLWTFSRLLYPDWPEDKRLASPYRSVHDPLVVTSFLAAVTSQIRLGLAVVNLPFYAPIVLAKALTSIDVLSRGRLDAGLGLGWSPDEFAAVGVPMEKRGARAEDYLACLDAIWTGDPVEYHGEFYDVPRGWVSPSPVQRPRPPVLLGGSAEPALKRAGRLADGWISASAFPAAKLPDAIAMIRSAASDAGRDPTAFRIVIRGVVRLRDTDEDRALSGTLSKIRDDLAAYDDAGADEVFIDLNFDEQIGTPDADPSRSMDVAVQLLEELKP